METQKEITICLGSSCFARGNNKNLEIIKDYIRQNNLKEKLTFKGQLCSGKCNEGPVLIVDGVVYKQVSREKVHDILDKHFKEQHE